jgi:hypothetical protein
MIKNILSRTPKTLRKVRNFAGALVAGNATLLALPEVPDSWIILANILAGVAIAIWGQSYTPEEAKKEADE